MGEDEGARLAELNTTEWTVPPGYRADNVGNCRSCGAPVLWAFTRNDKRAPLNRDGTSHFSNCPQAGDWRRR